MVIFYPGNYCTADKKNKNKQSRRNRCVFFDFLVAKLFIPLFLQIVTLILCQFDIPICTSVIIPCGGDGTGELRHIANQRFLMNQIVIIAAGELRLQQAPIRLVAEMVNGQCHRIILFCRFKSRTVFGICGKLHGVRKQFLVAFLRIVLDNSVKYTGKAGNRCFLGHTFGTLVDCGKHRIQIFAPRIFIRAIPKQRFKGLEILKLIHGSGKLLFRFCTTVAQNPPEHRVTVALFNIENLRVIFVGKRKRTLTLQGSGKLHPYGDMAIHIGTVNASKDRIKQFRTLLAIRKLCKTCHRGTDQILPPGELVFRYKVKPTANGISVRLPTDQTGNDFLHSRKETVDFISIKLAQSAVEHCKLRKSICLFDEIRKTVCRYREVHGNKRCVQIAVIQFHDLVVIFFREFKTVVLQTFIYIFLQIRDIRIRIRISFKKCSKQLLGCIGMFCKERCRVRF